jgi:hypothetical protein
MNTAQLVDGSLAAGDGEARAATDIELSAVAGLERPPPVEHSVSVETAVLIASSPESKTTEPSQKSGDTGRRGSLRSLQNVFDNSASVREPDAAQKAEADAKFLKSVVVTLMQRLEAKSKDDAAVDPASLIAKLTTLDKENDINYIPDMEINCHNYCSPLLYETYEGQKIWNTEYNHSRPTLTHPNFDSIITFSKKTGIYFGESKTVPEDGKKVPSGFGVWVSVDHHSETLAKDKPLCVFIMGGCWSFDGNNFTSLDGSMLHFFANHEYGGAFQRCVGFSYKGSFANKRPDKPAKETGAAAAEKNVLAATEKKGKDKDSPPVPATPTPMFDCQDKDAVFREFETAFHKTESGGGKMQFWLDMFIDSISDDGLERQKCRDFEQHMTATGSGDKNDYMHHILEHYLGGGMQYFVPAIVHGT